MRTHCSSHLLAILLPLLLYTGRAGAGDAIQFTPGKSKVTSELEDRLSKEKASAPARRAAVGMNGMDNPLLSAPLPARRTKAEDKKAKNAQLEKKNWILLNRGDLQEKDEAPSRLGVRDSDGDGIEKEKTVGEIWFTSSRDERAKGPAQSSRINTARPSGPRGGNPSSADRPSEDRSADIEPGRGAVKEGRDGQLGGNSFKDVEVREALVPDQQDGTLRDLFSARSVQAVPEARRDAPGGPSSGAASSSGTAPLILGKGLGLNSGSMPQPAGSSPLLDGGRRSTVPMAGPPTVGPAPVSRASGAGSSGGFLGSGGFSSGFQSQFGNGPGANNNQSPTDLSPGSSRRTFDTPIRR